MNNQPLDLSKLKSAEVVEGSSNIEKFLLERDDKIRDQSLADKADTQTQIEAEDGQVKVRKRSACNTLALLNAKDSETGLPSPKEVQRLAEASGVQWDDDLVGRAVPYWASDERVDRHGDIVRQNFNFSEFAKNPVMPFSHNWEMPPIGTIIRHSVVARKEDDYNGPALNTLNLFATEKEWPFADTIFRLVKRGFLKTSSIGFYPGKVIDVKDEGEREQLGLGRWGVILDENMLVEHSPTTVPANPGAHTVLNAAKKDGALKAHDVFALREMTRREIEQSGDRSLNAWLNAEAFWLNAWGYLFPEVKLEEHRELDVPFVLNAAVADEADSTKTLVALSEAVEKLNDRLDKNEAKDKELEDDIDELTALLHAETEVTKDDDNYELGAAVQLLGETEEDEEEDEDDDKSSKQTDEEDLDDDEDEDKTKTADNESPSLKAILEASENALDAIRS